MLGGERRREFNSLLKSELTVGDQNFASGDSAVRILQDQRDDNCQPSACERQRK
jgi:hypothetical protein